MRFAGIEIGGTKLQILIGDEHGRILDRYSTTIDPKDGAVAIRDFIENTVKKALPLDGIGVGFGGPVNRLTGEVWTSYHVEGWTGFGIRDWLEKLAGVPVAIDNDGNVACLGEAWLGAGRGHSTVFYITLGSGVGAGFSVDGRLYHGRLPGEMEFGHILLSRDGRKVQDSCSGWAVNEKVRGRIAKSPSGELARIAAAYPGMEAKALFEAMQLNDRDSREIFEETVDDLAYGLGHVVQLLNPEVIVIGGGLSMMGEALRGAVEVSLERYVLDALRPVPKIRLSELKTDVVPVGAILLVSELVKK